MTMPKALNYILAFLAVLLLIGFALIFGNELRLLFSHTKESMIAEVNDPLTYVSTALATLVGGVAAVFLGVKAKTLSAASDISLADWIRLAYVLVYVIFGVIAIFCWVFVPNISVLLRNLAATFFGLIIPAVSSYLGAPAGDGTNGTS